MGSVRRESKALYRSQLRRFLWLRRQSHRNQMRAVACTRVFKDARPGVPVYDGPYRPSPSIAGATGTTRSRCSTLRSRDASVVTSTTSASTATFRVCCGLSKQRSGPGTSGCAVAASASVSRGRGLRISSDRCLSPAHGSRSGSGVCNHESHQRKSRMVEISLSGSGEGPGRVTARPTLQRTFCHPAARTPQSGCCGIVVRIRVSTTSPR